MGKYNKPCWLRRLKLLQDAAGIQNFGKSSSSITKLSRYGKQLFILNKDIVKRTLGTNVTQTNAIDSKSKVNSSF